MLFCSIWKSMGEFWNGAGLRDGMNFAFPASSSLELYGVIK